MNKQRNEKQATDESQLITEGDRVLTGLTPIEISKREHIITGGQNPPKWSLPKRVVRTNDDHSQITVRDLISGKQKIRAYNDVRLFMGDMDHTAHSVSYNKGFKSRRGRITEPVKRTGPRLRNPRQVDATNYGSVMGITPGFTLMSAQHTHM